MRVSRFLLVAACTLTSALTLSACEQTWQGVKDDLGNFNTSSWDFPNLAENNDPQSAQFVENGNCPTVSVVEELSTVSEFADTASQTLENLISKAKMVKSKSNCEFNGKTATVDLQLTFEGALGPKALGMTNFSYPFFVAVTAPNGSILAKEVFSAPLSHSSADDPTTHYETLRQIIPISNELQGPQYKILIGFQLTQEQLAYNRSLMAQQKAMAAANAAAQAGQITAPAPTAPVAPPAQEITKPIIIRNPADSSL